MEEIFIKGIGLACLYALGFTAVILIVLGISAIISFFDEKKREREINRYIEENSEVIANKLNQNNGEPNQKSMDSILDNSLQQDNIRRL